MQSKLLSSPSPDTELLTAVDPRREAQSALGELLNKIAAVAVSVGAVALVASALRLTFENSHPNIIADIVSYAALLAVLLMRKRMPVRVVLWAVTVIIGTSAAANFLTQGLASISFVMLAACCVLAGAAFGLRAGMVVLGCSLGIVALAGMAVIGGSIPGARVSAEYLGSPQAWISQAAGYLAYTAAILVAVGGIQRRLAGSLADASHRAKALSEREQQYRHLAEHMRDVLFVQDMDLNVVYTSPAAEKLFGYSTEELLRIGMHGTMTQESLRKAQDRFRQYVLLAQEQDVEPPTFEFEYIRKDGSHFWGELKATFIRDTDGNLIGSQGILRDVTDRKRAEEERIELEQRLHRAERLEAIGQLAGGVAHDFNNQLAGIRACSDLVDMMLEPDSEVAPHVQSIKLAVKRASDLTGKLLTFARRGGVAATPVDMHHLIVEVAGLLQRSADKRIVVTQRLNARFSTVLGDSSQLQNALLNLGVNACDAMPGGGELVLATDTVALDRAFCDRSPYGIAPGSYLTVRVADTGTGMDPATVEKIFDPFFTTKESGKGTGLGLAAVYGTIKSHNGAIEVESTPGHGTVFTLLLPLVDTLEEAQAGSEMVEGVQRGKGRVLLVDDEDLLRETTAAALRGLGYHVSTCRDGVEAVKALRSEPKEIDLVILDMVMPRLSGRETFEALHQIDPRVKALLCSGTSRGDDVRAALEMGAAGFVRKPFGIDELSNRIAETLGTGSAD